MDQHLRQRVDQLEREVESLSKTVSARNTQLEQCHRDIDTFVTALADAQDEMERLLSGNRILYDVNGRAALFRRRRDGVFVEVQDPPPEEDIRNVRRRLNFESSDSDADSDDSLMSRLLGFEDE